MAYKPIKWCLAGIMTLALLSGCSSGSVKPEKVAEEVKPPEPVTLRVMVHGATISQDEIEKLLVEPVKKKYEHLTLEFISAQDGYGLEQMAAAKDLPDIIYSADLRLTLLDDLDIPYDLTSLIKKYNFDVSKYDQPAIDTIKIRSNKGDALVALPFSVNLGVLYYNKGIFDRFGVAYPKDGMTWEDAIELGKRIGRIDNGVAIYGLDNMDISHLSLPMIDYKTNRATFVTDGFIRHFTVYKAIKEIPPGNISGSALNNFMVNNILAMYPGFISLITRAMENKDLNWDLSTYPAFPERPGISIRTESHILLISSVSNYKDEAFQAIATILGEENQVRVARAARLASLNDPKLRDMFGADVAAMQGKNIKGALQMKPAEVLPSNKYTDIAAAEIGRVIGNIVRGQDVITALREAEEIANQKIAAEMAGSN